MYFGLGSPTLPSAAGYRTVSLSVTTVSPRDASYYRIARNSLLIPSPGKKLKKRLEDLERRAASSSASPEQKPAELQHPLPSPRQEFPSPASSESDYGRRTPEIQTQYMQPHDERMFSHQYTRQLSTSPPPFFPAYPAAIEYSTAPYHSLPATTALPEVSYGAPSLPPPHLSSAYPTYTLPSLEYPKYNSNDISPFGAGLNQMYGPIEISPPLAYSEAEPHVNLPSRKPYYAH